jgi:hypothetical protein
MTISGSDAGTSDQASSVKDTAREQAGRVGQTAAEAGRDVAGTTREQATALAQEATDQARNLAAEARAQAVQQVDSERQRLADSIRSVSDELRTMAERSDQNGIAAEITRQASARAQDLAGYLEQRNPGDLVQEVRQFARRRPGTFLAGALAAGLVVGRVTRSAVSARSDSSDGSANGSATARTSEPSAYAGAYQGATVEATRPPATPATSPVPPAPAVTTLPDEPFVQPGGPRSPSPTGALGPEDVSPPSGGVRP